MRKSSKPINMSKQDHEWFEGLGNGPLLKAVRAEPKRTAMTKASKPMGSKPASKAMGRCK